MDMALLRSTGNLKVIFSIIWNLTIRSLTHKLRYIDHWTNMFNFISLNSFICIDFLKIEFRAQNKLEIKLCTLLLGILKRNNLAFYNLYFLYTLYNLYTLYFLHFVLSFHFVLSLHFVPSLNLILSIHFVLVLSKGGFNRWYFDRVLLYKFKFTFYFYQLCVCEDNNKTLFNNLMELSLYPNIKL